MKFSCCRCRSSHDCYCKSCTSFFLDEAAGHKFISVEFISPNSWSSLLMLMYGQKTIRDSHEKGAVRDFLLYTKNAAGTSTSARSRFNFCMLWSWTGSSLASQRQTGSIAASSGSMWKNNSENTKSWCCCLLFACRDVNILVQTVEFALFKMQVCLSNSCT